MPGRAVAYPERRGGLGRKLLCGSSLKPLQMGSGLESPGRTIKGPLTCRNAGQGRFAFGPAIGKWAELGLMERLPTGQNPVHEGLGVGDFQRNDARADGSERVISRQQLVPVDDGLDGFERFELRRGGLV